MPKHTKGVVITGNCAVAVNQYCNFDPSNPEKTAVQSFTFIDPIYIKNGVLDPVWSSDGYVLVGDAEVTVRLIPVKEITETAITVLREQKKKIQAQAQMAINEIEGRIQNMLALPYIPEVMEV